jgi:hypothetical protein
MSIGASAYVVEEANDKQLRVWLKAGQWTRNIATFLLLDIHPSSVTYECFKTFSGHREVQYALFDVDDPNSKIPCGHDEEGELVYLTSEQDALFHKVMSLRFEIDLQLNSRESAEPQDWIDLACKKEIPIPWLDWAIARGLCNC